MKNIHDVVIATINKAGAEAVLKAAQLQSQERTVPATRRSSNRMLDLSKRRQEAESIAESWSVVLKAVMGVKDDD